MKSITGARAMVVLAGLALLLLPGCAWGAPVTLGLLVAALLVAASCGASSTPIGDGDGDVPCGEGVCPEFMTCVDTAERGPWCLPDADEDGLWDGDDNCDFAGNPDQADGDDDGVGDLCDVCEGPNELSPCGDLCCEDIAADGVAGVGAPWGPSELDNCPWLVNPDQSDIDGDGIGDACDLDDETASPSPSPCGWPDLDADGDGVSEYAHCDGGESDACPFVPSSRVDDADGDGAPDVCDPDGIAPIEEWQANLEPRRRSILRDLHRRGVLDDETLRLAASLDPAPRLG